MTEAVVVDGLYWTMSLVSDKHAVGRNASRELWHGQLCCGQSSWM